MDQETARAQAQLWLSGQCDLEGLCISTGNQHEITHEWRFKITKPIPNTRFNLTVFVIRIGLDLKVQIIKDRLVYIQALELSGYQREEQFLRAFEEEDTWYPDWFVRLRETDVRSDTAGIDGFGEICIPGKCVLRVPYQIKSSRKGMRDFFHKHPDTKDLVIPVVIKENDTSTFLRRRFFGQLGFLRSKIIRGEINLEDYRTKIGLLYK